MRSHALIQKNSLLSIKLFSNNGNMCTKKAFKIFIKWIKQKKWDFEAEYIQNKG